MVHWLTEVGRLQVTRWSIGLQRWVDCRSQDGTLAHRSGSIVGHKMAHWLTEVG